MDISLRKIELIEWLTRLQDERLIKKVETLRQGSIGDIYDKKMPKTQEDLQKKVERAEKDIQQGKVYSQESVEAYFKSKFNR